MRQHRGLRVRTRGLPYEREVLAQGRARRAGLSWSDVVRVEGTGPAMDGASVFNGLCKPLRWKD